MCSSDLVFAMEAQYGVKGGVNFSNLDSGQAGVSEDFDLGFNVGGTATMPIDEKSSVSADLLYSLRNSKSTVDATSTEIKSKLSFIDVPVRYNYSLSEEFTISAGGYFSYLISADAEVGGLEEDVKEFMEDLDYGLTLGGAYSMDEWTFSAAYNLGLADLSTDESSEVKSSSIQVAASYKFN